MDDPDRTIFEFAVPKGNYLVTASANIVNAGGDPTEFSCSMVQPIGDQFTRTVAKSTVVVSPGDDMGTINLSGLAREAEGDATLTMACEGLGQYNGHVLDSTIVAVEMAEATEE